MNIQYSIWTWAAETMKLYKFEISEVFTSESKKKKNWSPPWWDLWLMVLYHDCFAHISDSQYKFRHFKLLGFGWVFFCFVCLFICFLRAGISVWLYLDHTIKINRVTTVRTLHFIWFYLEAKLMLMIQNPSFHNHTGGYGHPWGSRAVTGSPQVTPTDFYNCNSNK